MIFISRKRQSERLLIIFQPEGHFSWNDC